jgi:alpha-beta hydrolase superfamily lysophospholipase
MVALVMRRSSFISRRLGRTTGEYCTMTVTQLWFGADARPLAGRYHVPADGLARGAIVLCQAFGVEGASAAPAMRELAERLVSQGLVVLRFDYDGTGDSAGDDLDDSRVEAWRSSIVAAVEFLRSRGHRWIGAVGLRLGATLLEETLRDDVAIDAAVLWDPCISGRTFLREQQLLLHVLSGEEELSEDGCRYGPGVTYTESTATALAALSLKDGFGEVVVPTLFLAREGQRDAIALADSNARPGLTFRAISGQIEFVGVEPAQAQVPSATLELITEWLSNMATTDAYEAQAPDTGRAVVGRTGSGEPLVEYPISIGTHDLFAICTEPSAPARSTTVIFLNAGMLDHLGPSRMWVELSRRWAALGFRTLRFDLSGIGESPPPEGLVEPITRSVHSLRQVAEVVDFVRADDASDVLLVGLCSGAYQAMEAAIAGGVRAVFLVNPDFRANPLQPTLVGESALEREVAERPEKWYSWLERQRFLWPIARRFPDFAWRIINSFGLATSRADTLVRLGETNVDVLVVSDTSQAESYARGRKVRLRRLSDQGKLTFARIDPLDHTVFGPLARRTVSNVLTSRLEGRYVIGPDAAARSISDDATAVVPPPR